LVRRKSSSAAAAVEQIIFPQPGGKFHLRPLSRLSNTTTRQAGIWVMRIAMILAGALLAGSLMATEQAGAAMKHYYLNIPRQPLDSALEDFAKQTGLQLGRLTDNLDGSALVGPIEGDKTPQEALSALLADEDLEYQVVSDNVIAIVDKSDGPAESEASSGVKNDEVVITGSRIKRADNDGPQDVLLYSKQQIQQSGQSTIADFLSTLPDVSVNAQRIGLYLAFRRNQCAGARPAGRFDPDTAERPSR
jgi:hypothetical protein